MDWHFIESSLDSWSKEEIQLEMELELLWEQGMLAGSGVDMGDFYGSFNVMADRSQFEVFATDPKTADLRAKYGSIFGLTQENKQILIDDYLRDKIATLVKSIIYG